MVGILTSFSLFEFLKFLRFYFPSSCWLPVLTDWTLLQPKSSRHTKQLPLIQYCFLKMLAASAFPNSLPFPHINKTHISSLYFSLVHCVLEISFISRSCANIRLICFFFHKNHISKTVIVQYLKKIVIDLSSFPVLFSKGRLILVQYPIMVRSKSLWIHFKGRVYMIRS